MLVDANLLLYAVDKESPFHAAATAWLTTVLNGPSRVGLPWQVLGAFVRIVTHPRASEHPLTPLAAWKHVEDWLTCDVTWTPNPTNRHPDVLGSLVATYQPRGNLVSDAQLAALALEHGLTIYSTDSDFARFREVRWIDPVASGSAAS